MTSTSAVSTLNLRKNLSVVLEWFPIIAMVTALGEAQRGVPRVMAALQILRFVAAKTSIQQDDQLLAMLEAICLTSEGRAVIDYVSDEIAKILAAANAKTGQ